MALQNAITSGDNAQAAALAAAKTALEAMDATLSANKLELVCGSFTGNAPLSSMTAQTVNLGFQPRLVLFGVSNFVYGDSDGYNTNCVAIYPGVVSTSYKSGDATGSVQITTNGFQVAGRANSQNYVHYYTAFR